MWYKNMYRRHLCDMHIDDWNDEFMSQFSPEVYVENLKKAKIQNAMIYLQSHAGLCYFPTKVGHMHKAFINNEDMIKRTVDLCHKNGIAVVGYYSLNYNTREHDAHPDWRILGEGGKSTRDGGKSIGQRNAFTSLQQERYGLCCPNNMDYRNFVYRQIDEMLDYFDVEGLFFDMLFWNHTCYCPACKARWENEVGESMPVEPLQSSDEYRMLIAKKYDWMGEWAQSVTDYVKSKNPALTVEHNFAPGIAGDSSNGCGEAISEASDFVGGDLYGSIYNHSLACKFYKNITKNMPFDYMFSRCKPALRMHTLTKTYDEMKTEIMLTAAHHGATMVIDAIDPVGTLDERVYDRLGKLFEIENKYESYYTGDMLEDVGLYYSMRSRYNRNNEKFNNINSVETICENLIKNHIPFGVTGSFYELDKYKVLIIPSISEMENKDIYRIKKYIENGGCAYISGAENTKLVEEILNGKIKGRTAEDNVYIAPTDKGIELFLDFNKKYPLPFEGTAPIIEFDDAEVIATITLPYTKPNEIRFASIHSNPPGIDTNIPAVVSKNIGKGMVIWSSQNIEGEKISEYQDVFINLLNILIKRSNLELSFMSDAPDNVELTAFEDDNKITVNVVYLNEEAKAKRIEPFNVQIKATLKPKVINKISDGSKVEFDYKDGYAEFMVSDLDIYEMYEIVL